MNVTLLIGAAVALLLVTALTVWRQPVLSFAQRSAVFLEQVRAEVRKVTWPGWDDLRKSTIVITILLIVIGIIIGVMDWLFSQILIRFLGRAIG